MASEGWNYEVLYKPKNKYLKISSVCTCGHIWGNCFVNVSYKDLPLDIKCWKFEHKNNPCSECGGRYKGRK
jgi:hypothetical protein